MYLGSIRARLRLATCGIALILLGAATLGWWSVDRLARDIERTVADAAQVQSLTNRFAFDVADELRAGAEYLLARDPRVAQVYVERGRDAHRLQSILIRWQLASYSQGKASEAELIARIDAELSRLETVYSRAHRLADLGEVKGGRNIVALRDSGETTLRKDLATLSANQVTRVVDLGAAVSSAAITRASLLTVVLLVAICGVAALTWQLSRSISRPLHVLVRHADALQRGARDTRTETDGLPGEFRTLAAAMNQATESLASLARTETALHQAEKLAAIGTLISGVAHELNNPLQSILLTTEFLREKSADDATRTELGTIADQVVRARTIIRDLLSTVRQDAQTRDVAPLEPTLRALERELGMIAAQYGASLRLEIASPLPPLLIDRVGLAQVIINLVGNAAFAAGLNGDVRLRAGRTTSGCEIVVDDSGPGIPAELVPRIFEPFFSTKPVGQGTGLGLSVSRRIVESMQGTLVAHAHGDGPASGARFVVLLPMGGAAPMTPAEPTADPAPTTTPVAALVAAPVEQLPRMLIVDDEVAIRKLLGRRFAARGWSVDTAGDGREALARIGAKEDVGESYDFILCDLRMPKMSGMALYDALMDRHADVAARIVFLSGDLVSTDVAEFMARSSCRVLCKPVDPAALDAAVNAADRRCVEHGVPGTEPGGPHAVA